MKYSFFSVLTRIPLHFPARLPTVVNLSHAKPVIYNDHNAGCWVHFPGQLGNKSIAGAHNRPSDNALATAGAIGNLRSGPMKNSQEVLIMHHLPCVLQPKVLLAFTKEVAL